MQSEILVVSAHAIRAFLRVRGEEDLETSFLLLPISAGLPKLKDMVLSSTAKFIQVSLMVVN